MEDDMGEAYSTHGRDEKFVQTYIRVTGRKSTTWEAWAQMGSYYKMDLRNGVLGCELDSTN
jgi:hypothetical protein